MDSKDVSVMAELARDAYEEVKDGASVQVGWLMQNYTICYQLGIAAGLKRADKYHGKSLVDKEIAKG